MPSAFITTPNCAVHLKNQRIVVYGNSVSDEKVVLREIPVYDIDRLIIVDNSYVSNDVITMLLDSAVPIAWLSWSGKYLGGFLPAQNAHGKARLRQYQKTLDSNFASGIACKLISVKIKNQRRVLQRLLQGQLDNPNAVRVSEIIKDLDRLDNGLCLTSVVDSIRGYEGMSTAEYFEAWSTFLPLEFPFERRSKRPPLNPVNACISFTSTLVYSEFVAFIQSHGLDAALGLLHVTEDGRWSLALDLMEPFRPIIVEALTLDLFSHKIVDVGCFEPKNEGIYLNDVGRKKLILQYERRLERQFFSEFLNCRTTLRQQLEQQVVMFKSALENIDNFKPFLMN